MDLMAHRTLSSPCSLISSLIVGSWHFRISETTILPVFVPTGNRLMNRWRYGSYFFFPLPLPSILCENKMQSWLLTNHFVNKLFCPCYILHNRYQSLSSQVYTYFCFCREETLRACKLTFRDGDRRWRDRLFIMLLPVSKRLLPNRHHEVCYTQKPSHSY